MGTLPTDHALFIGMRIGTIVLVVTLTYLRVLAHGPIVERLAASPERRMDFYESFISSPSLFSRCLPRAVYASTYVRFAHYHRSD